MRSRNNKAIAVLTLIVMLTTLLMPLGVQAATEQHEFNESSDNDGRVEGSVTITLDGGFDGYDFNQNDVPKGLSMIVESTGAPGNNAKVSISGTALDHNDTDSKTIPVTIRSKKSGNKGNKGNKIVTKAVDIKITFAKNPAPPAGGGETGTITRDKIRILEIYPNEMANENENIANKDVRSLLGSKDGYEVTTISINRLISLQEDINGNYDVVYFNNGTYRRNATTEMSYGSDITNLTADKLEEFIKAGQLCIFHTGVFNTNETETYKTILKERFRKYINNSTYKNVIVVNDVQYDANNKKTVINNIGTLYKDNAKGMNQRPILQVTQSPATYNSSNQTPVTNQLTFSFKVYDPETPINDSLYVDLYIDRNNDSLYTDLEIVYPQEDPVTKQKYTVKVKNGQNGTITYDMPQGLTGIYFWKLVVRDSKNAKNEVTSVFRLKGSPIEVKVLQVKPDGGGHASLKELFDKIAKDYDHKYGKRIGEYEIKVTEMTVQEFNKAITEGTITLNGSYDMIILGFADNYTDKEYMVESGADKYKGALGKKAVEAIRKFVDTKQSVMFTHDTIHFYKNKELTKEFGKDVGQVFVNDGFDFKGIWTAGLAGSSLDNWNKGNAVNRINMFDPQVPADRKNNEDLNNTRHYQVINTYPDTGKYVNPVNTTALTLYPFIIEGGKYDDYKQREVAATHYQWYKLDLEDPEVIPLFNLYVDGKGKFNDDAMNNYYTYTRQNITYSGTGHSGNYPDFETKLFVNTAIRAYSIANHSPEITIYSPQNNDKISHTVDSVELKFRVDDFDLGDDVLWYSVLVDKNNNGNFVPVAEDVKIFNGETVTLDIDKNSMPAVGSFKVKVLAYDDDNAESEKVLTLERIDEPIITPSIEIQDASGTPVSGVLVNEKVNAVMTFTVSGKSNPQRVVTPVFDLTGLFKNETEKTYLNNKSMGQVTFKADAAPTPDLITVEHKDIKIEPTLLGETQLELTAKVEAISGFIGSKSATDSVNVRRGQVRISVIDEADNPISNVKVRTVGETGYKTTDSSGQVFLDGVVGSKDYYIDPPAGYVIDSETIYKLNASGNRESTESAVNLTYDNYSWEVVFKVNVSMGVDVSYYKINESRTAATHIGIAGGSSYSINNPKFSPASILAKITIDPLAAGDLTKMEFELKTIKGGVSVDSGRLKAVVDTTQKNVSSAHADLLTFTTTDNQITGTVITGSSLADNSYYIIIDVPRTDGQTVILSGVTLYINQPGVATPVTNYVEIDDAGITFTEADIPLLR